MRLIRKVKAIEVKRAFLMTNFLRKYGVAEKRDRKIPTKEKYLLARAKAHKAVKKLTEKQLDKLIGKEWKKRLTAYNSVNWCMEKGWRSTRSLDKLLTCLHSQSGQESPRDK